ncbi:vitamin K epoxide reductase family protein [Terrabacter sp. Root181]|uniref:vitamin K epoxide reductase family protein n=1 Tax=Terrabacter sp. Root181 TaxID=1736484 RepID=UPI0006F7B1F7|nr:vitamin K epoxide reductase family protein [Terrabacter sp. Root181]KRB47643.1 Vitamin K epoxide reductase [Terrabacter sp. Root181]
MSPLHDDVATGEAPVVTGPSRPVWLAPVSVVLAVAGLLVSAYLTFEHFTANATLACSIGGVIDCAKVTTSAWSTFMGVPVALLGLVFFVVALGLCLPQVWRRPERWLDAVRLGWLTVGLGMALYLVWAELYRIHAICLWCTAVHVVTFLLWIVVLFGQILSAPADQLAVGTEGE